MKTKWNENKPDETSSMRIMAMIAVCLGAIVVVSGLVGFFIGRPESTLVIGSGCGLIALSLGAKSFQAQAEYREGQYGGGPGE